MKKRVIILITLIMIVSLSACSSRFLNFPQISKESHNQPITTQEPKIVTLYFGDSQGMQLNQEKRAIKELTPQALIEELIKGPETPGNTKTIPDGTKLLGVKIQKDTAYVDFSKEFKQNHWGGSSGESITLFSIVNTLALNPELGIKKVQFLIEGQKVETLAGHIELYQPLTPNPKVGK